MLSEKDIIDQVVCKVSHYILIRIVEPPQLFKNLLVLLPLEHQAIFNHITLNVASDDCETFNTFEELDRLLSNHLGLVVLDSHPKDRGFIFQLPSCIEHVEQQDLVNVIILLVGKEICFLQDTLQKVHVDT